MNLEQAQALVERIEIEALHLHPAQTVGTYYVRRGYVAGVLTQLLADVGCGMDTSARSFVEKQQQLAANASP